MFVLCVFVVAAVIFALFVASSVPRPPRLLPVASLLFVFLLVVLLLFFFGFLGVVSRGICAF